MMKLSIAIPSYKRPDYLKKCLKAISRLTICPFETIIILREDDIDSRNAISLLKNQRIVLVKEPGIIIAMNKALEEAKGDIIAFTDDDAEPYPDWGERIINNFEVDEKVAGCGGRDRIISEEIELKGKTKIIGKLQWFGREIDGHHLELDPPRKIEVDVLKGVNMAYRMSFIKGFSFDLRLNIGDGACFEYDICFYIKKKGGKLIYDPYQEVLHKAAPRQFGEQRLDSERVLTYATNYTYVMLKHFPFWRKCVFLFFIFLIGQRRTPGILLYIYDLLVGNKPSWLFFGNGLKGKIRGIIKWSHDREQGNWQY